MYFRLILSYRKQFASDGLTLLGDEYEPFLVSEGVYMTMELMMLCRFLCLGEGCVGIGVGTHNFVSHRQTDWYVIHIGKYPNCFQPM